MSLTVAVQMDPLESINIDGDSTFAIMLGAQARGHKLYYYAAEDLNYLTLIVAEERRQFVRRLAAGIASLQSHLRK